MIEVSEEIEEGYTTWLISLLVKDLRTRLINTKLEILKDQLNIMKDQLKESVDKEERMSHYQKFIQKLADLTSTEPITDLSLLLNL